MNNYYLDTTSNILRRFHPNCLTCSSEPDINSMHCNTYKSDYFKKEDNINSCYKGPIDNYYLDGTIFRKCYDINCLECSSYNVCTKCKSNYYLKYDDHSCQANVINTYYYDFGSKTLKKCHLNCLKCFSSAINETYMNCISCQPNFFITEDSNSCYNGEIDNYYIDAILHQ